MTDSVRCDLLDGLDEVAIRHLLAPLPRLTFAAGATILAVDDEPQGVFLILEGSADVIAETVSGPVVLRRVGAGASVGELSLLTGSPVSATVRATSEVIAARFSPEAWEEALDDHPRLVRNAATIVAAVARESVPRRPAPRAIGRVVSVVGADLPPLLGDALAASIRWHVEPDEAGSWSVAAAADPTSGEVVATISRADEVTAGAVRALPGDGRAPTVTVVPPATGDDDARVRAGLLDLSTPYGQAVGRLARAVLGLRVGVAFGAGSTRGYAHFGVLEVLHRHGVPLDAVAGTSIGAAVAYLAAIDHPLDEAMDAIDEVARRTIRLRLPGAALLSSGGLRRGLHGFCGEHLIEECLHPLAIVAADIERKTEVVFDAGLVWPALLASMSIPGLYPAQRVGGVLAIDGGVVNPIPITAAAALGADIVIAVRLGRRAGGEPTRATATAPTAGRTSAARTILRAVELLETTLTVHRSRAASVVIEAATESIEGAGLRRFADGRRYVAGGAAAAEDALPRLRALLPWLRRT